MANLDRCMYSLECLLVNSIAVVSVNISATSLFDVCIFSAIGRYFVGFCPDLHYCKTLIFRERQIFTL